MANRYTNITPSVYTPMTLEEIAMVPAMKRKQHDELLAKQELIRSGLAKVDPLSQHYDEAVRLKKDLESKMDLTAQELAERGIDNDMIGKTIGLNREFQDLTAPTGRIGQINTAKQIYDKKKEEFLKAATENYGTARAAQLWEEKVADPTFGYTGYDKDNKIINIGDYGVRAKQDYQKDLLARNSILGSTMQQIANEGGRTVKNADGSYTAFNSKGEQMTKTNLDQVNQMTKAMTAKWLKPGGEGFEFNREAGIDLDSFAKTFTGDMLSQLESSSSIGTKYITDEGAAPMTDADKAKLDIPPTGIHDPDSMQVIGEELKASDFESIGTPTKGQIVSSSGVNYGQAGTAVPGSKMQTYKDLLSPRMQGAFEMAGEDLIKSGKLPKGTKMENLTAAQAKIVSDQLKANHGKYLIGNDIVKADVNPSEDIFMGALSRKPNTERSTAIMQDLNGGTRTIIDPVTRKELTPDEWKEKGYKISYYGYDNPLNYRGYNFGDKLNQTVMAHKVNVYDADGKPLGLSEVSRSAQEMETSQFKSSYNITHTYRNAVNNVGKWMNVVDSGGKMNKRGQGEGINSIKGYNVRYNKDGTIDLRKGKYPPLKGLSPKEFEQIMYDLMLNKQQ